MWGAIIPTACGYRIKQKRIDEGLHTLGMKGEELSGILITHEHSDHIQGLGVFSRKYGIPVYATKGTLKGIREYKSLGKMPDGLLHEIEIDTDFLLGDLTIHRLQFLMMLMNHPDTGSHVANGLWLWLLIWASMMIIQ